MAEAMSARRAGGRPPEHGRMAARLSRMLKRQIDALEAEPAEGFSETKVKALLLLATSAGGMPPPYDEAEPGSSARNRTVVLRLIPQAGTIPMPGAMAQ